MSKLKIIQSLIEELEFRGNRKENIERAEALKDVVNENTRLQDRVVELENMLEEYR